MRNQLIKYIDLLFAGNPDTEEIKQEILQNTLDRYDDLIAEGKTPEAAYSLAISGIGDIGEILGGTQQAAAPVSEKKPARDPKKLLRAAGVAMYILCPVPLFVIPNEIGFCLLLLLVAVATALIILSGNTKGKMGENATPQQKLRASLGAALAVFGVAVYLVLSFSTGAWYITWLVFPIMVAIRGIVAACIDLKEAS